MVYICELERKCNGGLIQGCNVSVVQDKSCVAVVSQGSVRLFCQITTTGCGEDFNTYWFRYLVSGHQELSKLGQDSKFIATKSAKTATLEIKDLQLNDSAVYVCGIVFTNAVATGSGTTLMVKEHRVSTDCIVLIFLCCVLLIYSIAVFLYTYRSKLKRSNWITSKGSNRKETDKNLKSQRIFQTIAQEYHKRYPRKRDHQNDVEEDDTIYQNTQEVRHT
ncbi:immunoglobulin superfamily member 6 isoform X2 [Pelobates fuscus]|uniref:immunoglobulin superfamily member 6 isoform X2 n=1 Tax=Pelobates fuscus TaxID=191477 RepID=UPI002FE4D389